MKNKWFIASVLIVVLIGLCATSIFVTWQGLQMAVGTGIRFSGFNPVTTSATTIEQKTLTVTGPVNLSVQNEMGDISVTTGPDGQVSVKAEKTAWGHDNADAQAALKDLKVVTTQDGNNVSIVVQQPAQVDLMNFTGHGVVKFTVTVPAATAVTLRFSNGDVAVDGTTGSVDAQSDFGNVTLSNITGEILGKSNNGAVTARNVSSTAPISLASDFGSVTLDTATATDVSAASNNGSIVLKAVTAKGLLKVDNQFGNITISDSQAASAQLNTNNGTVKLVKLDLAGVITAQSDFGTLELTGVKAASYDLTTQNGKIGLDGAQGTVKAHSDAGDISVVNAQNVNVDLSSNNGTVTFSGSLGAGPHKLKSDFGNINITLPADAALKVDLQTDFGQIRSDFTVAVQGKIDNQHSTGSINGGGPLLTASTNNGNIVLESSK